MCVYIILQECWGLLASLILILFVGLMTSKLLNATTFDIMIQKNFMIWSHLGYKAWKTVEKLYSEGKSLNIEGQGI